jgi:hypothetical protein
MSAFRSYPMTGLLAAIGEHLAAFELAAPASVEVRTIASDGPVSVQLDQLGLPAVAAELLAWADTLTDVSAHAWRTHGGDSVHLRLLGRLTDGTGVRVYDSVPAGEVASLGLDPNSQCPITLGRLRAWADLADAVGGAAA